MGGMTDGVNPGEWGGAVDRRAPIYSVLDGSPIADWRAVAGTDRGDRRQDHRSVVVHFRRGFDGWGLVGDAECRGVTWAR